MKIFLIISWTLFTLGLILKLFQLPGAGESLTIGSFFLLVHSIIYLFKNAKRNLPSAFLHLSIALWTFYLMIRIRFWGGGPEILGFYTVAAPRHEEFG
jgi:hypothetical protein